MRVTENMRLATTGLTQKRLANQLEKASRIAGSGEKVTMPSDDPVAYASRVRSDHALALNEQRSQVAAKVSAELSVAEGALSSGVDVLAKARELAVGGMNATLDAGSRKLLAQQARELRSQMLDLANTRYGTKYIFAGSKTDTPPFDAAGTFVGNDNIPRVALLDGVSPPTGISGARSFTPVGGRDVLADLEALADALDANDVPAVSASVVGIDASASQLVRAEAEARLTTERVTAAADLLSSMKVVIATARAAEVEGDPIQHLTNLTLAKTAYERGIGVTQKLLSVTSISRQ